MINHVFQLKTIYLYTYLISIVLLLASCGSESKVTSADFTINGETILSQGKDYDKIPHADNQSDADKLVRVSVNEPVEFKNTSVPSESVQAIQWDMDDDTDDWESEENTYTYTFEDEGLQRITMKVNEDVEIVKYVYVVDNSLVDSGGGNNYSGGTTSIKDSDKDGVPDSEDDCPRRKGTIKGCPDSDGDFVADKEDDCPNLAGLGAFNGCPDTDGDGIPDRKDKCPYEAGPKSNKGCKKENDRDTDGDGIPDKRDNCKTEKGSAKYNGCPPPVDITPSRTTTTKSVTSTAPPAPDSDGDGVPDKTDQCSDQPGLIKFFGCPDTDGDGLPDNRDDCPNEKGLVGGCPDGDGDGIIDKEDSCPTEKGTRQYKGCKPPEKDSDKDGFLDYNDKCPFEAGRIEGCPDSDNDGIIDKNDKCPDEVGPASSNGCPPPPEVKDSDSDGFTDDKDECPNQKGTLNGCPDRDGDGFHDGKDACPDDPGTQAGCPKDSDKDGIPDSKDDCPDKPGPKDTNGCPKDVKTDSDNDGIANDDDECPDEKGPAANDGCPYKFDGNKYGRVGHRTSKRKEVDTSCKSNTSQSMTIKITPRRPIELESASVYADKCGSLEISLSASDGTKETMTTVLSKGNSPFELDDLQTTLEPGVTYVLTLTPKAGNEFCGATGAPQLENIGACGLTDKANCPQTELSYNGSMVLFDLKFIY